MGFLKEIKKIFDKTKVEFIESENLYGDYYLVKLKPQEGKTWVAGEHGRFSFTDRMEGGNWRLFSLASAPEEGVILLGTHTGNNVSAFKRKLLSLNKGDILKLDGPFGFFKPKDDTSPMIMISAGVGITPIRALLFSLKNQRTRNIEVIHASNDYYIFEEDLNNIAENNEKIYIHRTKEIAETKNKIDEMTAKYGSQGYYYISGSPKFIKSVKSQLKQSGISKKHIVSDPGSGANNFTLQKTTSEYSTP